MFMACYFYVNIFDLMSNRICEYFIDQVEHNNCTYIEFYINYAFSNLSKLFLSVFDSTKRLGHKKKNF